MQFGICLPIADAGIARAAGFDFVEPTVRSLSPLDPDFDAIRAPFDSSPLPTPVFNVFVPAEVPVTGPNVNWEQVESYLEAAIGRVAAVGGEKIVFGSGGARNVPDGFDKEEAFMQLVRFLRLAGNVAVRNGVTIVIEPLNSRDSNIITSVAEGMELARETAHLRVRLLADLYHMMEDDEPLENITTCAACGMRRNDTKRTWFCHPRRGDGGGVPSECDPGMHRPGRAPGGGRALQSGPIRGDIAAFRRAGPRL